MPIEPETWTVTSCVHFAAFQLLHCEISWRCSAIKLPDCVYDLQFKVEILPSKSLLQTSVAPSSKYCLFALY